MKKLLAIVVLGLLLNSCTQQNRNDEYSCRYEFESDSTEYLSVLKDKLIFLSTNYAIEKETSDKIIANGGIQTLTFFKRTKKLKSSYTNGDIWLYNCEQLN